MDSINTITNAFIGEAQRAEFDALRNDRLMISAAKFQISNGWNAKSLNAEFNNFSNNFCQQWINHGKPAPGMIGLPAWALIAAMRDIEATA
jgi:hypothetical protein